MKEILKKASEFKVMSDQYRTEYEKTHDPAIIADFYKKSFMAMKEAWVLNEVGAWFMRQEFESIESLNLNKGERRDQNRYFMVIKQLMIFDKVNNLVSNGATKTDAFKTIAKDFLGTAYSPDSIRNSYYKAHKFEPEIRIEETETESVMTCGPTRIWMPGCARLYGFWEIRTPKQ